MDIMSGLSAASTAIGIAKDLREIDRSVDEASYKLKIAELVSLLADAKLSLSEAKQQVASLEEEILNLTSGHLCPMCRSARLKLVKTEEFERYPIAQLGVENWFYECEAENCEFEKREIHDPHGVIPKQAAKR
ncbi:hypothetical protein [Cognatishimia maritima]|uniref:Uncharacterized protein n=1 Tax=Cognatishimia maritima TaxID=870908 RepID=A0A1M5RUW0_9RHOB|nr:hypothetical protein [Cognatishimia maritima]SHH29941.1 hypothetical protein SAMN04488044_2303 [Cognatishimia maritima]